MFIDRLRDKTRPPKEVHVYRSFERQGPTPEGVLDVLTGLTATRLAPGQTLTVRYLNSKPQLRHLFGSLTSKNNNERRQVNGAPITATSMAHNGTVPFTTLVELHLTQCFGGTTDRAFGCGIG